MKIAIVTRSTENLLISGGDQLIISGGDQLTIPAITTESVYPLFRHVEMPSMAVFAELPATGGEPLSMSIHSVEELLISGGDQLIISGGDDLAIPATTTYSVFPFPAVVELPHTVVTVEV